MSSYRFYRPAYIPNACSLANPDREPGFGKIDKGQPFLDDFAGDYLSAKMNDDPDRTLLFDAIGCGYEFMVISEAIRKFLEKETTDPIEYIPMQIRDQNGVPTPEQYWVVNVLEPVDCLNKELSVYEQSSANPNVFIGVDKVVLHEERVPEDRNVFKIEGINQILFSNQLIEKMGAFSNFKWCSVEGFRN